MDDLERRLSEIVKLLDGLAVAMGRVQNSDGIMNKPLNLSKLLRPRTILNALRQITARKKQMTMDSLRLCSAWDQNKLSDQICLNVKGMLLQGAMFDGRLQEVSSSALPTTGAPILTLAWTPLEVPLVYPPAGSIDVPLYTDASRETLVAVVQMPCDNVDAWNIAAVALFMR